MKILLVENSPSDAGILVAALAQLEGVEVDIAESLDSANELIQRRHAEYDLAIFDLQIPTTDQALDEHVDHGLSAFVFLGKLAPGTIRFVWSGKATNEAWEQLLNEQHKADPLGRSEQETMVKFFSKEKFRDCIACLTDIADSMTTLNAVQWSWGVDQHEVTQMTRRVVDIFTRRRGGVIVQAAVLGDGLSSASVLRLEIKAENGAQTASVVGKIDKVDAVRDELSRYARYVPPVLRPGAYAPLSDEVLVGADGLGGAFYSLIDPQSRSLWEVAAKDSQQARAIIGRLVETLSPWQEGAPQKRITVGDVRRSLLSDVDASSLDGSLSFDRQTLEARPVYIRESVVHGDLHGQNVLVDSQGNPILIDYGEVKKAAAAIDPVTLELSSLLHPNSPLKGMWDGAQPNLWGKPAEFYAQSPHLDIFLSLREWAHKVGSTDGEVLAAAYAYCLRQLKYDDVDHGLALQLTEAAANAIP